MGFPRDYLDFTTWYLQKKGYITRADNSDFTLTAAGVDFVETQRMNIPVLNRLLTSGTKPASASAVVTTAASGRRMIVLPDMTVIADRRSSSRDRRASKRDRRLVPDDHQLSESTDQHSRPTEPPPSDSVEQPAGSLGRRSTD